MIEAGIEPDLHALLVHAREAVGAGRRAVHGGPEARVLAIDLLHDGAVQLGQLDDRGAQALGGRARRRAIEERELAPAAQVLHDAITGGVAVAGEQAVERRQRVLAVVDDVPEHHLHAALRGQLEDPRLADPGGEGAIALGGKIDHHPPLRFGRETDDPVGAVEVGQIDRPGEVAVEAEQRPM